MRGQIESHRVLSYNLRSGVFPKILSRSDRTASWQGNYYTFDLLQSLLGITTGAHHLRWFGHVSWVPTHCSSRAVSAGKGWRKQIYNKAMTWRKDMTMLDSILALVGAFLRSEKWRLSSDKDSEKHELQQRWEFCERFVDILFRSTVLRNRSSGQTFGVPPLPKTQLLWSR